MEEVRKHWSNILFLVARNWYWVDVFTGESSVEDQTDYKRKLYNLISYYSHLDTSLGAFETLLAALQQSQSSHNVENPNVNLVNDKGTNIQNLITFLIVSHTILILTLF